MKESLEKSELATRPHSLVSLAQARVEELIFNGHILPGKKVKESVIADRIGFSRGPVREACRALVAEGYLVSVSQRGVFVRDFSAREIADLYQIRGHLGLLVGQLAAANADEATRKELHETLERMERAVEAGALEAYFKLTTRFNDIFLEMTGNSELATIYARITRSIRLYRVQFLHSKRGTGARSAWLTHSFQASIKQRHSFLEALNKRDGDLAGALLKRHAQDSRDRTESFVSTSSRSEDIGSVG